MGQAAYREHVPEWADRAPDTIDERVARSHASLVDSGWFRDIEIHRFPWTGRYTADEYVGLVSTYSDHILLPPATLRALLDDIHARIEHIGGTVERMHEAVLFLATPYTLPTRSA